MWIIKLARDRWTRLELIKRFSIVASVCVLACALVFGWLLKDTAYRMAQDGENDLTAAVVRHQFSGRLSNDVFRTGQPIQDPGLGEQLLAALSLEDVFRIKLYGTDGQIIWSDETELLGRRFPDNVFLERALQGEVVSVIETPHRTEHVFERGTYELIMEVYVPIFDEGSVVGVAEIYRHPERFFRQTRNSAIRLWSASLIGGALLWFAMVGIVRRISNHQRKLEMQLRQYAEDLGREKATLEGIVNAVGAGLVLVDREGRIRWANQKAVLWFGQSEPLIGASSHLLLCQQETPCEACPLGLSPASEFPVRCERRLPGSNGNDRLFEVITTPQHPTDDDEEQYLQLILDVTESREMEAQLQQATKVALIGQLAAGIAHHINNPAGILLTTITHHLGVKETYPSGLMRDLEMMERQCRRIDHSVRSLLSFARTSDDVRVEVDLRKIIGEAVLLGRPNADQAMIEVETRFDGGPWTTLGDPNELMQVVLILINNAIDAMPDGGKLNLDLRSTPADHSQGTDGPALLLTVSDSGRGIIADAADRIFDPFFTTKEIGSGTGLGLAVAKRIVESAGGLIGARSGTEAGAVFEVLLPRAEVLA